MEKLKNEMQSGTFDLKNHTFTDTIVMRTALADKSHAAAAGAGAAAAAADSQPQDVRMAEADGAHVAVSNSCRVGVSGEGGHPATC